MVRNEWTCCCWPFKMHIETGAWIIAVLGCVLNIYYAIWSFLHSTNHDKIAGISGVVSFFLCLFVIIGLRERNHRYYWPYLIVTGIELVVLFILIMVSIAFFFAAPTWTIDQFNKAGPGIKMDFRVYYLLLVVNAAFNTWFYSVIYKAYKFVRDEPASGVVQFQNYPTVTV